MKKGFICEIDCFYIKFEIMIHKLDRNSLINRI